MLSLPQGLSPDEQKLVGELHTLGVPLFVVTKNRSDIEFAWPSGWNAYTAEENGARLEAWQPGRGLCAVMGGPVAVVDCDPRNGADVEKIRGVLDDLGVTVFAEVATPSGGRHFYVQGHPLLPTVHASRGRDGLAGHPGIEIISFGALVFLPGTQRPKYQGATYEIVVNDLEAIEKGDRGHGSRVLADWVADHRPVKNPPKFERSPMWEARAHTDREEAYLAAVLHGESRKVAVADLGERNLALFNAALRLGNWVAGAGLPEMEVIDRLVKAAEICDLVHDDGLDQVMATIASGLRCGKKKPRTFPFEGVAATQHEFWDRRPELAHIRTFAFSRMCAPSAILGHVLLRALASIPPHVVLPPVVGGHGSLNLFVALVANSGGGKGGASQAVADVFHWPQIYITTAGSGEGLVHQFAHEENGGVVMHRLQVLFEVSEIDALNALRNRQGSTIMSQLRSAYTGETLGFSYADPKKRIRLERHSYRMGLVIDVQPGRARDLLGDADGGTPQRFVWLRAKDPDVTYPPPDEPAPLRFPAIDWEKLPRLPGTGFHSLKIPDSVRQAILRGAADRHQEVVDALDGHALFTREKIAVALAVLNGRTEMNEEDWELAGQVMKMSDATRAWTRDQLAKAANRHRQISIQTAAETAVKTEEAKEAQRIQRVASLLRTHLADVPLSKAKLRKILPARDRDCFEVALTQLAIEDQVHVDDDGTVMLINDDHTTPQPTPRSDAEE